MQYLKDFEPSKYFIDRESTTIEDLRLFLELAGRAIGLLHNNGLLHGDLTTSNILVNKKGPTDMSSLYLIDFGLS